MKRRITQDVVAELAKDLVRVQPVARLRVVAATVLAVWGAVVFAGWLIEVTAVAN